MSRRKFRWGLALLFVLAVADGNAQEASLSSAKPYPYRGKIINEEAQVYEQADFDAVVITTVTEGQIFDISKSIVNGAFYKIRITRPGQPSRLGFIADSDIKPLFNVGVKGGSANYQINKDTQQQTQRKKKNSASKKPVKKKSFEHTRYVGVEYALIDFQEETMNKTLHESLGFVGMKVSGPNVLLEGLIPMDVNLLFYSGAPGYYSKATGNAASGFIFLGNILLNTYWPFGKDALTYFGFGPMLKYSKFDVELRDRTTNKNQAFSLEDITVGVTLAAGVGLRAGPVALRVDYQYFYEKQPYGGFTGSVQWGF